MYEIFLSTVHVCCVEKLLIKYINKYKISVHLYYYIIGCVEGGCKSRNV